MKSVIQFLKIIFLIGTHGMAIAGVFCAVEVASRGNLGGAIALGATAGIIILDLIAWWSSLNAEPTRRQRLGNILYWGGCICAALLAVSGVFFAISSGVFYNPYWVFVVLYATVVFWLPRSSVGRLAALFFTSLRAVERNSN
jgi:hypothetical protein